MVVAEDAWSPRLPPRAGRHPGPQGTERLWAAQASRTCICRAPAACRAPCKALDQHCLPEYSRRAWGGGYDPDISEKEPRLSEVKEPLRGVQPLTDHTGVLS